MAGRVFISTTGSGLVRASEQAGGAFTIETLLPGTAVSCLAVDPLDRDRVYAGIQGGGVLRSNDRGRTWWRPASLGGGQVVKAIAASPVQAGVVYAGTKPAGVFISRDGGETWAELEAFRHIPWRRFWFSPAEKPFIGYVQAIALSATDAEKIAVGIEAGATVLSRDGGLTWSGHLRGALRDCHSLIFHPSDGGWAYEAGGTGGGSAFSRDGGDSWLNLGQGMDRHYGWAVAADPERPEVWYVSASPGPHKAHSESDAQAYIFRHDGSGWQRLAGGLPQPLSHMPYALLTEPGVPGSLYAGLSNGDIWQSSDYGETWQKLSVSLGVIRRALVML